MRGVEGLPEAPWSTSVNDMLVIVNYGVGNLGSILNMCRRVGIAAMVSSQPDDLQSASHLLLPGVGRFDFAMARLRESGLVEVLENLVFGKERKPILGICVGAQMMAKTSEENAAGSMELVQGLGWLNASVKRFPVSHLPVPHMGWAELEVNSTSSAYRSGILRDLDEARFYFAHSYYLASEESDLVAAQVAYGIKADVVLASRNIWAVQFHPEKSHRYGMQVLRNFSSVSESPFDSVMAGSQA